MTVMLIKDGGREIYPNIDRVITYEKVAYLYRGDKFYVVEKNSIAQIEQ